MLLTAKSCIMHTICDIGTKATAKNQRQTIPTFRPTWLTRIYFLFIFAVKYLSKMESVKKQLVSGTIFIATAKYTGVAINMLITAILARILVPEQFAIVAISSVLSNFFNLFSDFGFASAIIQRQELKEKDHSNIFSFSVYLGIFLSVTFVFLSELFANIYEQEILGNIVKILAIQVFFTSLNIVPNALLTKAKEFRFIAARTIVINLISGAAAVLFAYTYRSIYSLIIAPILTSVLLFIVNTVKVRTLRFTLKPDFGSVRKILNYSSYNLGYNIINYLSRNIDKLLIGKHLPMNELGYYEKSYTLMLYPIMNIIGVLNPVIHPVLSKYQNDSSYIYNYFCAILRTFAWIGFPISVVLITFSDEFIHIFLGSNWEDSIPVFQTFAISIGFQIIYALHGPFFLVRNAPKALFLCGIVTAVLNTVALLLGIFLHHNTTMIAWFIDIAYIITTAITFYWLYRVCFKSKYSDFWVNILPAIVASAAYIGIVFTAQYLFDSTLATVFKYAITTIFLIYSVIKIKKLFRSTK